MHMRFLVALPLVLLSFVASLAVAQQEKTSADYWRESELKYEILQDFWTPGSDICYSEIKTFMGCWSMLKSLALGLPTKLRPVVPGFPSPEPVVVKIGGIDFVKMTPVKKVAGQTMRQIWEVENARQTEELSRLYGLYNSGGPFLARVVSFAQALQWFRQNLIIPDNEASLTADAINAYLRIALDPHSYIVTKAEMAARTSSADKSFAGIGADLTVTFGTVILVPHKGSPAEKAGVHAQDVLLAVNGEPLNAEVNVDEVVKKLRGPAGTDVRLTVNRKDRHVDIVVIRGVNVIKAVTSEVIEVNGKKLGYVQFASFSEGICEKVATEMTGLIRQGVQGWILDLRKNPGGNVDESLCLAGRFMGPGVPTLKEYNILNGQQKVRVSRKDKLTDLPLVVLIDGGSASASEILSGALQDHKRAWILGDRSYGKGSMQGIMDWQWGVLDETEAGPQLAKGLAGVYLARTIAVFFQPLGRTNQVDTIIPNFYVPHKPGATEDELFVQREKESYFNALRAPQNPAWSEPRPQEVDRLQSCVQKTGKAQEKYQKEQRDGVFADYQLHAAEDLLSCQL